MTAFYDRPRLATSTAATRSRLIYNANGELLASTPFNVFYLNYAGSTDMTFDFNTWLFGVREELKIITGVHTGQPAIKSGIPLYNQSTGATVAVTATSGTGNNTIYNLATNSVYIFSFNLKFDGGFNIIAPDRLHMYKLK